MEDLSEDNEIGIMRGNVEMVSINSKTGGRTVLPLYMDIDSSQTLNCYNVDPNTNDPSTVKLLKSFSVHSLEITMPKSGQNIMKTFALRNTAENGIVIEFICPNNKSKMQWMKTIGKIKSTASNDDNSGPGNGIISSPSASNRNSLNLRLESMMANNARSSGPTENTISTIRVNSSRSNGVTTIKSQATLPTSINRSLSNARILTPRPVQEIPNNIDNDIDPSSSEEDIKIVQPDANQRRSARFSDPLEVIEPSPRSVPKKLSPERKTSPRPGLINSNWGQELSQRPSFIMADNRPMNSSPRPGQTNAAASTSNKPLKPTMSASQMLFAVLDQSQNSRQEIITSNGVLKPANIRNTTPTFRDPISPPKKEFPPAVQPATLKVLNRKTVGAPLGRLH